MDLTLHRQQVARALTVLETSVRRLIDALTHRPTWVSTEGTFSDRDVLKRICTAYASINYAPHDDAETSIVCMGVAGVSAEC